MNEDKSFSSTVAARMGPAAQREGEKPEDARLQRMGEQMEPAKPQRPPLSADQIERAIQVLQMVRDASPRRAEKIEQIIQGWREILARRPRD